MSFPSYTKTLGYTSTHLERDDVYRACSLHDPVKIKNNQIERRESKRTFTYEERNDHIGQITVDWNQKTKTVTVRKWSEKVMLN